MTDTNVTKITLPISKFFSKTDRLSSLVNTEDRMDYRNKFINFKMEKSGFTYTFDKTTTHKEFETMMDALGMNDWRVFGTTVYFYMKPKWDYECDSESESESEEE